MRVLCPVCGQRAIIGKNNRLSLQHCDLYCSCSDPVCGWSGVFNLSYSHTLSPSAKDNHELLRMLINAMAPEQRKKLQRDLAF